MAKDERVPNLPTQTPPAQQQAQQPKRPQAVELEGLEQEKRPSQAEAQQAKQEVTQFTRCFLISHLAFGATRIFAEDKEEAVKTYIAKKCPGVNRRQFDEQATVSELIHRPAETEVGKPHGWKAPRGKFALAR